MVEILRACRPLPRLENNLGMKRLFSRLDVASSHVCFDADHGMVLSLADWIADGAVGPEAQRRTSAFAYRRHPPFRRAQGTHSLGVFFDGCPVTSPVARPHSRQAFSRRWSGFSLGFARTGIDTGRSSWGGAAPSLRPGSTLLKISGLLVLDELPPPARASSIPHNSGTNRPRSA